MITTRWSLLLGHRSLAAFGSLWHALSTAVWRERLGSLLKHKYTAAYNSGFEDRD